MTSAPQIHVQMLDTRQKTKKNYTETDVDLTASVGCTSFHDPRHDDCSCVVVPPYRRSLQHKQSLKTWCTLYLMILEELNKCQQRESVEKEWSVEEDGLNV